MQKKDRNVRIGGRVVSPESLMMSYGYRADWSEGAIKCPIFQTATFAFKSAEDGKACFQFAVGAREPGPTETAGLIYSRMNNPDVEILEDRLTLWDDAEACCIFSSGMAAIATTILAHLGPGDVLLHSVPLYGGTEHLFEHVLTRMGLQVVGFNAGESRSAIEKILDKTGRQDKLKMILIETPANPTNALVDIEECVEIARKYSRSDWRVPVVVDNTFLGPIFQRPMRHGADLVIYSATKYIGGHSDVIAGVCLGSKEWVAPVRALRSFLGTTSSPWDCWLLLRSLETLKLRMTCQADNAQRVADYLMGHPKVERVHFLGHIKEGHPQYEIYRKQCLGTGGIISFDIRGGEKEAFKWLNALQLVHLAVSLGGTESLAQHPATMTHSDVRPDERARQGIGDGMIRLSIGVEHPDDLIADLQQAFDAV
jgi:methionine-gamma-lyase